MAEQEKQPNQNRNTNQDTLVGQVNPDDLSEQEPMDVHGNLSDRGE